MTRQIGFIGLGNLGFHLAASLIKAGFNLTVHDLNRDTAAPLLDLGAVWADSPAAAASRCDTVITCLPSPAAVTRVVAGEAGILAGLRRGGTWIDCSTNDLHELKRLAGLAAVEGIQCLEAPVTGGVHKAASGDITVLVGGEGRLRPALTKAFDDLGIATAVVPVDGERYKGLVFDATGITTSADLVALQEFFTPVVRSLKGCGRVLVIGTQPDQTGSAEERIAHLERLLEIQHDAVAAGVGGFTEFVPIPIPGWDAPLLPGRSRIDEHRAMVAVSRLLLRGGIRHVQGVYKNLKTPAVAWHLLTYRFKRHERWMGELASR